MEHVSKPAEGTEPEGLRPYLSPVAAWSLAVGTSIGWGSFVMTSNSFLSQAGPLGSMQGLVLGMALMLVIARNYHYLMERHASAGGAYAYACEAFSPDFGFVVAWFLLLTYAAMLWANATALPLFARSVLGGALQVGFHYQLYGYDVYLGEALVSGAFVALTGWFCATRRRGLAAASVALVTVFTAAITVCFGAGVMRHGAAGFSMEPLFAPGDANLSQVLRIAYMAPWAFVGMESISHSSEELAFERSRSFGVMASAILVVTLLYMAVTLLSATAYPAGYDNWVAYIADLPNLTGLERYPAFFAAQRFLGGAGVALLVAALLALVLTSLIGNTVALSRLIYALAHDGVFSRRFAELNAHGVPGRAVRLVVLVSVVVPFLGRTAIGWIVDVTTMGATISYGIVSAAAFARARAHGDRLHMAVSLAGVVIMVLLGIPLLLPVVFAFAAMASESYFLFTVWGILGFICFRSVLLRDEDQRFGGTIVVWIALLSLVLVTSLTWMSSSVSADALAAVEQAWNRSATVGTGNSAQAFLAHVESDLRLSVERNVALVAVLFVFSMGVMLSNFSIIQRREQESRRQLGVARTMANTDQLTGVKNKTAYAAKEADLNAQIEEHVVEGFAVVVCDVNGLKQVNDTLGHKAGDRYIRSASMLICQLFKHSPVYRVGGDEFVVVLQGGDYERRDELMANLDWQVVTNQHRGDVVVAAGMSEYVPDHDTRVVEVFDRADALMYERKRELKGQKETPR